MSDLPEVDWSALTHAYGPATDVPGWLMALRSPDDAERDRALSEFYGAVHHQGDVYTSTTACLPFLFALATDPAAPGRAELVTLLVSIAEHAVDQANAKYAHYDFAGSAAVMRSEAETFVDLAADPDPGIRAASYPAPALLFDDPRRAFDLLRERLPAAHGIAEQLAAVTAMGALAVRRPQCEPDVAALLGKLATDPAVDPATRLAAVVQRARCASYGVTDDLGAQVVELLRLMARTPATDLSWADPSGRQARPAETRPAEAVPSSAEAVPSSAGAVPSFVVAAFEDLARANAVYAPTTEVLRTLHELLGDRVTARTSVLTQQLRSPDAGTRLDAVRMSQGLLKGWRGDHTAVVTHLARLLAGDRPDIGAEAAAVLSTCTMVAEPAREALAAYVTALPPRTWVAPEQHQRRAFQEAVLALAQLGDARSLPALLVALDTGIDEWRAVNAIPGSLRAAAGDLTTRLCSLLTATDEDWRAHGILTALTELRTPSTIPIITDFLQTAARQQRWNAARQALQTLTAFGPDATGSLPVIRALTMPDPRPQAAADDVWPATIMALAAIGGDAYEVVPAALDLIDEGVWHRVVEAADILGRIGPPAAVALPRLQELLTQGGVWVQMHAAVAIWDIAGADEAAPVLDALLSVWRDFDAATSLVLACLDRMGAAAEPALPQLRAWLARPRRGDRWTDNDEELQRLARTIMSRF